MAFKIKGFIHSRQNVTFYDESKISNSTVYTTIIDLLSSADLFIAGSNSWERGLLGLWYSPGNTHGGFDFDFLFYLQSPTLIIKVKAGKH